MLGAIPAGAHALHWNEDGFEPPPGAVEVLERPRGGRAEGFRIGRLAWGVQFHPEVDDTALDGWYAEWGEVLAPAGVTEADIRAADARHLPDQAALSAAIFGAFARLVRDAAGRTLGPRLIAHPGDLHADRAEQDERSSSRRRRPGRGRCRRRTAAASRSTIANGAQRWRDARPRGGDDQDDQADEHRAIADMPMTAAAQLSWVASEIATDCARGSASASARS